MIAVQSSSLPQSQHGPLDSPVHPTHSCHGHEAPRRGETSIWAESVLSRAHCGALGEQAGGCEAHLSRPSRGSRRRDAAASVCWARRGGKVLTKRLEHSRRPSSRSRPFDDVCSSNSQLINETRQTKQKRCEGRPMRTATELMNLFFGRESS